MSEKKNLNFIEEIIEADLASGKTNSIITRFPPEPNGYLHLGHAKSICLNFGLALKYGGKTNLRFDDTNPTTEETEYVESIKEDVRWLDFSWANELYASDYFSQLYEMALTLIKKGLAYVDESSSEAIAEQKGSTTQAGKESPHRNRAVEENIRLFNEMKEGKHADGAMVLRAKIDMAHPNLLMRDPVLYRIKKAHHHRTGNEWCIYPMYDFAHGQSDSIEKITHSICTLEFVPHRDLYDWLIEKLDIFPSRQYEFARLNVTYMLMSKRKLLQLVNDKYVSGWDDPRMPTISGLRRRGFTAEAIRTFCDKIGIQKRDNLIDIGLLEFCLRDHLNLIAQRRMAVMDPILVELTNYEGEEQLPAENNPEDEHGGTRSLPFGKFIWIERDDFMETPVKNFHRLSPGQYVRLKSAYIIQCHEVIKDEAGNVVQLKCTYVPTSKSGHDTSGLSVKGVIHWVEKSHAVPCSFRLYDRLFMTEDMGAVDDFKPHLNPTSLETKTGFVEPAIKDDAPNLHYQFLRLGYFYPDKESTPNHPIFNRAVTLRDTWSKEKKGGK